MPITALLLISTLVRSTLAPAQVVSPVPILPMFTVIFTGICTFAKDDQNNPVVLFPKVDKGITLSNGHKIPAHASYVRFAKHDLVDPKKVPAGCTRSIVKKMGFDTVCYLNNERLELAGPFEKVFNDNSQSYKDAIVHSADIIDPPFVLDKFRSWPPKDSAELAARFDLTGGSLLGLLPDNGYVWRFNPQKNGTPDRGLGQAAYLILNLQGGSDPIQLLSGSNPKLAFKYPTGFMYIEIGQIEKKYIKKLPSKPGHYPKGSSDEHFFLHYALLDYKCKIDGHDQPCPIPEQQTLPAPAMKKQASLEPKGAAVPAAAPLPPDQQKRLYALTGHNCPPRS